MPHKIIHNIELRLIFHFTSMITPFINSVPLFFSYLIITNVPSNRALPEFWLLE
jgi:hypothetical protein